MNAITDVNLYFLTTQLSKLLGCDVEDGLRDIDNQIALVAFDDRFGGEGREIVIEFGDHGLVYVHTYVPWSATAEDWEGVVQKINGFLFGDWHFDAQFTILLPLRFYRIRSSTHLANLVYDALMGEDYDIS